MKSIYDAQIAETSLPAVNSLRPPPTSLPPEDMELELPKLLYAEGPNLRLRRSTIAAAMQLIDLKEAMSTDYDDVKKDPAFTHIMAIAENKLKFSGYWWIASYVGS
ncbi:hypothetical protein Bca52824_034334 [Brassica carinata]|uniref:Uncharacterized protein n=1 Tax=Brassica carinata TaxID=52824 RepID=A0A8X7S166_BRACI|nr:hypothetical protein Bca52824_034334 [Brassica carinata]